MMPALQGVTEQEVTEKFNSEGYCQKIEQQCSSQCLAAATYASTAGLLESLRSRPGYYLPNTLPSSRGTRADLNDLACDGSLALPVVGQIEPLLQVLCIV